MRERKREREGEREGQREGERESVRERVGGRTEGGRGKMGEAFEPRAARQSLVCPGQRQVDRAITCSLNQKLS